QAGLVPLAADKWIHAPTGTWALRHPVVAKCLGAGLEGGTDTWLRTGSFRDGLARFGITYRASRWPFVWSGQRTHVVFAQGPSSRDLARRLRRGPPPRWRRGRMRRLRKQDRSYGRRRRTSPCYGNHRW